LPRRCTICEHPQRDEINKALIETQNIAEIAKRYGVSYDSLFRHKQRHIPEALAKAQEARQIAKADSLLDQVRTLQGKTLAILEEAEKTKNYLTALKAIREARGNLELLAKLLGELQEKQIINILVAPEWISLRAVILTALEPYPEAKQALAEALKEVEENGFPGR